MVDHCRFYYITDRKQFAVDEVARRRQLLVKIREAANAGVDYIQLREKDLSSRELEILAHEAVQVIRESSSAVRNRAKQTHLLINSRTDIALGAGADGVHLRSDDVSVEDVRSVLSCVLSRNVHADIRNWSVAVSCHSEADVKEAAKAQASFAVLAPVFEKQIHPAAAPVGLDGLRAACRHGIPVFAPGGVNVENAGSCIQAGATGVAGIRLFQQNDVAEVMRKIRG